MEETDTEVNIIQEYSLNGWENAVRSTLLPLEEGERGV